MRILTAALALAFLGFGCTPETSPRSAASSAPAPSAKPGAKPSPQPSASSPEASDGAARVREHLEARTPHHRGHIEVERGKPSLPLAGLELWRADIVIP